MVVTIVMILVTELLKEKKIVRRLMNKIALYSAIFLSVNKKLKKVEERGF